MNLQSLKSDSALGLEDVDLVYSFLFRINASLVPDLASPGTNILYRKYGDMLEHAVWQRFRGLAQQVVVDNASMLPGYGWRTRRAQTLAFGALVHVDSKDGGLLNSCRLKEIGSELSADVNRALNAEGLLFEQSRLTPQLKLV